MLDLEGSLKVFEPISVLQMINLAQASGELRFVTGDNSARIYFDGGNVASAGLASRPLRLGELLIREKRITKKNLDRVLGKKGEGKKLGLLLVEAGVINERELKLAIEEQVKEVIYEVVRWRDGIFSFAQGRKPKAQDIMIDIPLDHLMLEGLKRLDEERQQL
ncbi:MAG: DUF4388 domain-containing protein [Candidatus Krumholzibacteria bacterium]|nr:DUF4388 domain-containing protein [Candidatus Krumholzibacteria bacterium]